MLNVASANLFRIHWGSDRLFDCGQTLLTHTQRTRRWAWAGVLVLAMANPVRAQDPSTPSNPSETPASESPASESPAPESPAPETPTPETPAATASVPGAATAEYQRVFAAWKSLLKELRDLREQFAIAEEEETAELREQFLAKVAQGKEMVPKLRAAALAAFAENPLGDRELTRFLVKLAGEDLAADRFEAAREITDVMLAHQTDDKSVYDLAGAAAFALQDFDVAEKQFAEAAAYGVLDKGKSYQPVVAEMKSLWAAEQALRAAETAADDLPRVRIETSKGELIVELFENEAPQTVGNFISLVKKGFYDGLSFHRVLPGFMAQGGCPRGDGTGDAGYSIYCECIKPNHRNHFRGSLSMAKGEQRNTGGSQFFITFQPTPHLNGEHTVFGRVIEGFDVLAKLQRRDPTAAGGTSIEPDKILKAEVIRDRGHEYVPTMVN